jgi:hypothetical protein
VKFKKQESGRKMSGFILVTKENKALQAQEE